MFTLTSSRSMEGTKTVAKGLFPWKTEHVYPMTGHHRGSRNLRSKRQIFSRNLNGKVDLYYKNRTCGLLLRCSCGCNFRNTAWWCMLYMLAGGGGGGGSTVRCEERDWEPDMPDQNSPLFPPLSGDGVVPPPPGVQSKSSTPMGQPIANSGG